MCFAYQIINLSRTKQYNSCSDSLDSLCISVNNQLTVLQRELFFLCLNSLPGDIVVFCIRWFGSFKHPSSTIEKVSQITPARMCNVWHMLVWPSSYACRQQYHPGMVNQMLQNSTTCKFIFNNLYSFSTRYVYHQHFIFAFNNKKRETGKSAMLWRTTSFILKIITSGDIPRVTTRVYARKCS